MRVLLLLLAACPAEPPPVAPDADTCAAEPEGWYRHSDNCAGVVRLTPERWAELGQLRDAFVVYSQVCGEATCGAAPLVPPMPGVVEVGAYVEGSCAEWREWDAEMVRVAAWAECVGK